MRLMCQPYHAWQDRQANATFCSACMPPSLCCPAQPLQIATRSESKFGAGVQVMLDWVRLTEHIENSPAAKEALGWVREMYAFSIAAAMQVWVKLLYPAHPMACMLCTNALAWVSLLPGCAVG